MANVKRLTCSFEQPCMEHKQELQTAINLQITENPLANQATTRLPVNKQNTYDPLLTSPCQINRTFSHDVTEAVL